MLIEERLFVLSHVTCQLLGRWFPLPVMTAELRYQNFGSLDVQGWASLIEFDLSSMRPALYWMESLIQKKIVSIAALSEAAARHCESVASGGGQIVAMCSDLYPPMLRHLARPPHCISIIGNQHLLLRRGVAVIGSRRASAEALRASMDIGRGLVEKGLVVVSGGAIGCDIAAHEGSLLAAQVPLGAIVVFAGGLASRFPRCNERVFRSLLDRGGLFISERLWFQDVLPRDFPSRNRIVSGLCEATIVMAAALRSGSMITAQEALEQGRDVFVFEPSEVDIRFDGSRKLIAEGAHVFQSAADLVDLIEVTQGGFDSLKPPPCHVGTKIGTVVAEP